MSQTRTLWQRCEALGQFEDFKDDHVRMRYSVNRWLLEHDGHIVIYIHQDRIQGSEWLADAILCHIERVRSPLPIPNDLPDVTYVVEAPTPTEPTQEQIKALYDLLSARDFESEHPNIAKSIKVYNLRYITGEVGVRVFSIVALHFGVDIVIDINGRFRYRSNHRLQDVCEHIGFDLNTLTPIEQSNNSVNDLVFIRRDEWTALQSNFKAMAKVLCFEITDVEEPKP